MNEELLTKFMLGETTPEENGRVTEWLNADQTNARQFAHLQLIWETSKQLAEVSTVDENAAWVRFKQKTQTHRASQVTLLAGQFSWLRVAAIFVLVPASLWVLYTFVGQPAYLAFTTVRVQTAAEVRTVTLPDGSVVTLNRNSNLQYPKTFSGNRRDVHLESGEAFFDVVPNKSRPFHVRVNNVTVRVVGTSFNVKRQKNTTEVIVETGKVEVQRENQVVALTPTEKVLVNSSSADFVKETNPDQLYTYYRSNEFKADGTPLWRLVEVLNEAYDVRIVIARESLRNLPLNTTFKNESLDTILTIISQTFQIEVVKKPDQIILR